MKAPDLNLSEGIFPIKLLYQLTSINSFMTEAVIIQKYDNGLRHESIKLIFSLCWWKRYFERGVLVWGTSSRQDVTEF